MSDSTSKVHWREWNDEAFADARAQRKPILLGISAVWCHWCHVMDHGVAGDAVHTGVYNNAQIADVINVQFIPIRVDNDQRPDINTRYNQGGWPTTCFLTPNGELIYGGTYFAPSQMRQLIPQVLQYWQKNVEQLMAQPPLEPMIPSESLRAADAIQLNSDDIAAHVTHQIELSYDRTHGGIGDGQKFPMSDAWELLLAQPQQHDKVTQTLTAMGTRGMYDLVEGGWFRYSTTPDWSVPHFEKMLEDHARLLMLHLHALQVLPTASAIQQSHRQIIERITRASLDYLEQTLLHDRDGATYFAGSQDADEEYYALSRSERAVLKAPFIDWRLYADWNALMADALLAASYVLGESRYAALALRVLDTFARLCVNADGSVTHSITFVDGAPRASALRGMLGDQAALARALLRAHALGLRDGKTADALIDFAVRELRIGNGAFCDAPRDPSAQGMLRARVQPIFDNCAMADALLLRGVLSGESDSRTMAQQALAVFVNEYKRYGYHGSAYALAVMRATTQPTEIVIVADDADARMWLEAAHQSGDSGRIVRVLHPHRNADEIRARGYPIHQTPVAFVCHGTTCSAPIYDLKKING